MDDDPRDSDLLRDLGAAVRRVDPPPAHVVAAAEAAFGWRNVDDELAELLADSAQHGVLAGVRSQATARTLSFAAEELAIELEVSGTGGVREVVGQLVPAAAATVEVRHTGGTAVALADARGRFMATGLAAGVVSLRVSTPRLGGVRSVATPWMPM